MGIVSATAAQAAADIARREAMKKGKTEEQKKIIDFLFSSGAGGCGCTGSKATMTMQEYIAIVQRRCQSMNLQARALQKIGLDPSQVQEIPPVMLSSFVYDDDCLIRVDNNIAVSSQYSITWIYFSATQMYTYKYIFDTTSDNTWEFTKDFFYTDITCFSTLRAVKEKIDVTAGKGCMSSEEVTKNHYVVDTLEIIVPGANYSFSLRNSETIEQSIQAAKAMVREKKYSR
ncbi:MAG: hypothetical protein IJV82_06225 [Oscillospiraceae bacterium]|nr:hypothetical protein [Oscillospiraceae bacterium]